MQLFQRTDVCILYVIRKVQSGNYTLAAVLELLNNKLDVFKVLFFLMKVVILLSFLTFSHGCCQSKTLYSHVIAPKPFFEIIFRQFTFGSYELHSVSAVSVRARLSLHTPA